MDIPSAIMQRPWPSIEMPFHVGKALGRAYARINEASSLTAMYGQLVDVIAFPPVDDDVLSQPGVQMRYYDAVPVGFIHELLATSDGAPPAPYMTIGFEYGPKHPGSERVSSNDPARDVFREHRTPPRCVTQDCFEQVLASLSNMQQGFNLCDVRVTFAVILMDRMVLARVRRINGSGSASSFIRSHASTCLPS